MTPEAGHKRKALPTFAHFPKDRAKKMKQAWIDKQKMRSKWKAEKRREGIDTKPPTSRTQDPERDDVDDTASDKSPAADDNASAASGDDDPVSEDDRPTPAAVHEPPPSRHPQPSRVPARGRGQARGAPSAMRWQDEGDTTKSTLRDLRKQAYAAASLHTRKADPLHRRTGQGRGGGAERGGHGRGRGRGAESGRGRGQPDMRLRMNMMLEQIKQNYS